MIPDNLIPLIYLVAVAIIGGGLHWAGVPDGTVGLIVGAGLMRVKPPPPPHPHPPSDSLNVNVGGK